MATTGLPHAARRAPWWYGVPDVDFVQMFEGLRTAAPVATSAVFTLTPVMAAGFGWRVPLLKGAAR